MAKHGRHPRRPAQLLAGMTLLALQTLALPAMAQTLGSGLGITSGSGLAPIGAVAVGAGGGGRSALAGNPASAASISIDNLFNNAFGIQSGATAESSAPGEARSGFAAGNLSVGGVYSQIYTDDGARHQRATLPIAYTIQPDIDPNHKLSFRLPISTTDTGSQSGTHYGLGVDYRYPINDRWSLTPALSYTNVRSDDFGRGQRGDLFSAGLTSVYVFDLGGSTLSLGNMLGYVRAPGLDPLLTGGITAQENTVLRNGLMYASPLVLAGKKLGLQLHAINTHYFGKALYDENINEIGVSLGTGRTAFSARDYLRAGLAYQRGQHSHGWIFNVGYWF